MDNWFEIENSDSVDSPVLLVYPERILANIRMLKSMIDDPNRLRPHVKTHKMAEVTAMLLAEGIEKFKCATIAEAEMLGQCVAKDVLLAYQPTQVKLYRLIELIKKYPQTTFSCLVDNPTSALMMAQVATEQGIELEVFIDLNIGMNRTGISPDESAVELTKLIVSLPSLKLRGLHAYDGQIHTQDLALREIECEAGFDLVTHLADRLKTESIHTFDIVIGGTPTFPFHAKRPKVECSPGTFIFWDFGYLNDCPEQKFLPAAVLMTRVISRPEGRICLDLGHKTVASENPLLLRVHFLNAAHLQLESHSEEHLVVKEKDSLPENTLKIGDVLYALPIHICPTVALYEKVAWVQNRKVEGYWQVTARNRALSI